MTELVVVSGKGGTGKTSLIGSLAALSQDKVLVDCDVDAADLHLILQNNLQKTTEFIGGKRAVIIEEKCTNCGICPEYCRFDAIKHEVHGENAGGERYWIDEHACDGCGVCVRHCPEEAIDFRDVTSGEWYISDTPYGPLVHARLGIAQANSGKLVSVLRRQARELADQRGLDLILIDGPPGIGCPVIASITGTGYVLIVTEPSMSAMYDMERLLQLTVHFGIPTGICINKSDINPAMTSRIEEFAKKQKVSILGRIPFDPAVTKAQMAGTTVVEHATNGASKSIRLMWSKLSDVLKEHTHN
ncbi:MAG: (4Fe-4S)-binding protein [Candidatus Zixiibacteriota bacterium]|nr:MAG: (4Fe-4S)-binding protein [candidate division Zixibacteria bacterium]